MKRFKVWLKEMVGTYAIVKDCKPTKDYQIWGACSDIKKKKKKHGKRLG